MAFDDERVVTLTPQGIRGVTIIKDRYELVKDTLINILKDNGESTITELSNEAEERLNGRFSGSLSWYVVSVELDLEARGIIERVQKNDNLHKFRLSNVNSSN